MTILGAEQRRCVGASEAAEQRTVSLQAQERRVGGSAPPARSATATLSVSLLEPAEAALAAAAGSSAASGSRSAAPVELGAAAAAAATNVWLVVAICAVSSLFLLALVLYGASRWAPRAAVLSAPGPTTLVCASEVGSWSYSQRHSRSLCVADGAPKSDLMVFSPNFPPPPPGAAPKDTQPEPSALLDTVSASPLLCSFSLFLYLFSPLVVLSRPLDLQKSNDGNNELELVLTKSLDRETIPVHRLVLTASDGGRPSLTGTMELVISVVDANDNAPQFNQSVYKVQLPESAAVGTLVARVNATDADEGSNKEFSYNLESKVLEGKTMIFFKELFTIDAKTGEIRLTGSLDFEDIRLHELQIEATDKGTPSLSGHCSVELEVLDVNDNAPEVWVTSLSVPVSEDASVGTVVALLSVSDRDSGANGRVRCWVWPALPFGLEATFAGSYSLVLREALDRERVSEYEVEVRAEDGGAPALRASRGLRLPVSDVNDNAPSFAQAVYTVLARENNAAGAELARLWARDPDEAGNGRVSYSLWEGGAGGGGAAPPSGWRAASSYVALDAESGRLWALQPLDYEQLQVLQFEVRAVDAGEPPLCGNATVQLFVLDENDNAPALLPPAGSAAEAGAVAAEAAASRGKVRMYKELNHAQSRVYSWVILLGSSNVGYFGSDPACATE
ncbi:PREDICTED: protocadherin alpha-8-like [Ficedula albicollis]|uniref:protocadherin alpha-8-like n=1 Tax=Ficedula albicollis TaxID=59894 RepID=UPI0007AD91C4|nr:PREDICTED: protocadherin alpha-8-like [Ficedula albicollis]